MTNLWISWSAMHGTNFRWCVGQTPHWLWHLVTFSLLAFLKQILDWTRQLLHFLRRIEQVHLVILVTNFVRQAACPSLDLVEFVLLLVVACFANVDLLVGRETTWSTLVIACEEHNKTAIDYLIDRMIAVLASLDDLVLVEVAVIAMDCLLGAIVPASIDPLVTAGILPGAVKLCNDRLREIVSILDVYPVACGIIS